MQDLAVFTGDIVRSTDMEHATLTQMFVALEAQCATIGGWPDPNFTHSHFCSLFRVHS